MDERDRKRFGRYEVLTELGRGAMGVVYKAHDPKINRTVAVKTISLAGQDPEEEQEYRQRFFREAEAAGRVSHPGIVTIFDVGEEPETRAPYIVMEFVGGESLEKLLSRGDHKLPMEKALQLALELAEALECAHAQGVVHRDLKPANILMTEDGHAKIADFGVAKLNLANHTLAGRALGTPAYMSPEQLNGDPVDGRSDLFSLGVILYTAVTGYRPFQGNSALTVSFKVVNRDPIPATLLDTELPERLDAIITRAMAKDPAERYQCGIELVRDIKRLREEQKSSAEPQLGETSGTEASKKGRPINLGSHQISTRTPLDRPAQVSSPPTLAAPVPAARSAAAAAAPISDAGRGLVKTQLAPQPSVKSQPVEAVPAKSRSHAASSAVKVAVSPLDTVRKRSVIAVLVVAGLFILGLWMMSFGSHQVRSRAAAPLPHVEAVVPVKTESAAEVPAAEPPPPSTPAPESVRVKPRAKPVVKELPKTPPPQRTIPPPVKIARTAAPIVIPVVSRPVPVPVTPATLEIEVDHKFAEANLSVWVDDSLTYTHVLEGTDKKRLGVFHHVQGHEFHAMQISPGKHTLRVQVTSEAATYNQSAAISGDFATGQENVLRITFSKHGDMNLGLK
jgi:serine/threonine protein kinase